MKKLGLMLCLALAPLAGAACSSSGDTGDGAADGGGGFDTGGSNDAGVFLSRGMGLQYTVTAVSGVNDGCMIMPAALLNTTLPVDSVDTGTMLTLSVGNKQGSPATASLGTGVVGTSGTLTRDNITTDGGCNWHQKDTSVFTLTGGDTFTLMVTEVEDMFAAGCTGIPTGGTCTSTFTLTLAKAP
jgi:hypothetical protein